MWSSSFLVEVAMKFNILLAVPRKGGKKKPEKPCKLFGTNKCFRWKSTKYEEKKQWTVPKN